MKSFRRLASLLTSLPSARPPSQKPPLGVELLETRDVPATFTVTTLADAGAGSLRQAVADANAMAGADTVAFSPTLTGTIVLTTGEIDINDAVTVAGPGTARISVSGNNASRIFYIDTAVTRAPVLISGLTLTAGRAVDTDAGALPGNGLDGGALYNRDADLTIQNCVITGNVSVDGDGGAIADASYGRLLIQNTVFTNNHTYGGGGALYSGRGNLNITIEDCTFSGNTAGIHGGALYLRDAAVTEVRRTTFAGNTADRAGGALYFGGTTLVLDRTTFSGNTAGSDGGALYLRTGDVTITNSTFSGNKTDSDGGAILMGNAVTSLAIRNSTITGNTAGLDGTGVGGGLYLHTSGTATVENTIIANNLQNATIANDVVRFAAGTLNVRFSLIETAPAVGTINGTNTSNIVGVDPVLGPLGDNGGPVLTHALLAGSPAVNAGDPAFAPPPATDQRGPGFPRVAFGRVDIGAFEAQPIVIPPTPVPPLVPQNPIDVRFAAGAATGGQIAVYLGGGTSPIMFAPYMSTIPGFAGGIAAVFTDVTGDGISDLVTVITSGGPTIVKVFDGVSGVERLSVNLGALGGVSLAAGDTDGDGKSEIIIGLTSNLPAVGVFDGQTGAMRFGFLAYPGFNVGVNVAAGDLDGDGRAEIITAPTALAPLIRVFDGGGNLIPGRSFMAFSPSIAGVGLTISTGDFDGDGKAEIVAGANALGSNFVLVFNADTSLRRGLQLPAATPPTTISAVGPPVGAADLNGDGADDLLVTVGPLLYGFDGRTFAPLGSIFPIPGYAGGIYLG